jgi:hypothetical protein
MRRRVPVILGENRIWLPALGKCSGPRGRGPAVVTSTQWPNVVVKMHCRESMIERLLDRRLVFLRRELHHL